MGDFAITHPRQEEVLCKERLQRRLDGYRKHHIIKRNEYDNYTNSEFEKVREDTKILHQKWLEGKAKKGKSKLGKNDSGNLNVGQQKSKQRVTGVRPAIAPIDQSREVPPSSQNDSQFYGNSVYVNINVDANLNPSQNGIKFKFSSTITGAGNVGQSSDGVCKSELTDPTLNPANNIATGGTEDVIGGPEYFDVLDDLFHDLDSNDQPGDDFLADLDTFDVDLNDGSRDNVTGKHNEVMSSKEAFSNGSIGGVGNIYANNAFQSYGFSNSDSRGESFVKLNQQSMIQTEQFSNIMPPTMPSILSDTGPAAETLKQMAAQHQSMQNAQYMNQGNGPRVPCEGFYPDSLRRYPSYSGQGYSGQQGVYPYPSANAPMGFTGQMHQPDVHSGLTVSSGAVFGSNAVAPGLASKHKTKSLPSYAEVQPSSLKQLHDQVHSHFGPGGQETSPLAGADQMQRHPEFHMSQMQQMTVQGGRMTMSQQQMFNMSARMMHPAREGRMESIPNVLPSDSMKMQQFHHRNNSYHPYMPESHHKMTQNYPLDALPNQFNIPGPRFESDVQNGHFGTKSHRPVPFADIGHQEMYHHNSKTVGYMPNDSQLIGKSPVMGQVFAPQPRQGESPMLGKDTKPSVIVGSSGLNNAHLKTSCPDWSYQMTSGNLADKGQLSRTSLYKDGIHQQLPMDPLQAMQPIEQGLTPHGWNSMTSGNPNKMNSLQRSMHISQQQSMFMQNIPMNIADQTFKGSTRQVKSMIQAGHPQNQYYLSNSPGIMQNQSIDFMMNLQKNGGQNSLVGMPNNQDLGNNCGYNF